MQVTLPAPLVVPEKTDVALFVIADSGASSVTAMGAIRGFFELN